MSDLSSLTRARSRANLLSESALFSSCVNCIWPPAITRQPDCWRSTPQRRHALQAGRARGPDSPSRLIGSLERPLTRAGKRSSRGSKLSQLCHLRPAKKRRRRLAQLALQRRYSQTRARKMLRLAAPVKQAGVPIFNSWFARSPRPSTRAAGAGATSAEAAHERAGVRASIQLSARFGLLASRQLVLSSRSFELSSATTTQPAGRPASQSASSGAGRAESRTEIGASETVACAQLAFSLPAVAAVGRRRHQQQKQ